MPTTGFVAPVGTADDGSIIYHSLTCEGWTRADRFHSCGKPAAQIETNPHAAPEHVYRRPLCNAHAGFIKRKGGFGRYVFLVEPTVEDAVAQYAAKIEERAKLAAQQSERETLAAQRIAQRNARRQAEAADTYTVTTLRERLGRFYSGPITIPVWRIAGSLPGSDAFGVTVRPDENVEGIRVITTGFATLDIPQAKAFAEALNAAIAAAEAEESPFVKVEEE